ncbi:MAG: 50S ribosomal protein L21, partial [Planctomycetaceae bacterium]|nr:50S ribosomal protein L21 [Planctomycetaceae bacterium]
MGGGAQDLASILGDTSTPMDTGFPTETPESVTPSSPDDLTLIEGIGPKTTQLLYENGIDTFNKLANAQPGQIRDILTAAGGIYAQQDPTTWAQQA